MKAQASEERQESNTSDQGKLIDALVTEIGGQAPTSWSAWSAKDIERAREAARAVLRAHGILG